MEKLSSPFHRELAAVVPAGLLRDVTCFILSDEHPFDKRPFDVAVCTAGAEVFELQHGQVRASVLLRSDLVPRDIAIYRNRENVRFYLVSTLQKLYIISTKDNLTVYKQFHNVDRFSVSDPYCNGSARLRVRCNDDAVPVTLDDNFEKSTEYETAQEECEDSSAFVSSLNLKLIGARHTVALNEKRFHGLLEFRQAAMHTIIQDMCPNSVNSTFKSCQKMHEAITAEHSTAWLKFCNGKVVIGVTISNETDKITFHNIKLILQSNTDSPISYHTQIYTPIASPPFWQRKNLTNLEPKAKVTIVAATDLEEFTIDNEIQYIGVVTYEMEGNEKFIPLHTKTISCYEILKDDFDLLSLKKFDKTDFLAILATTTDFKVQVLQIPSASDECLPDLISVLLSHMKMERAVDTENILIHRTSPYHVLNGLMITFDNTEMIGNIILNGITLYWRNKSQLSSLLHLIYDAVPHRLLTTIPDTVIRDKRNTKILSKKSEAVIHSSMDIDDILQTPEESHSEKLREFGNSLCNQMGIVLNHFDDCMFSMAASKNSEDVHLVGTKIDVASGGPSKYLEFSRKLSEEIRRGNVFLSLI